MTDLRVATITGEETTLDGATVDGFRASLRGQLICPGGPGYDETRKVWNGMIDRRPALIARCAGLADVVAAVRFARSRELLVSVRGGGHNAPGVAVCEGGLMIDLAGMHGVRVNPAQRTARAEGGATWADFDRETQAFGLATTGGAISNTGIGGLTLVAGSAGSRANTAWFATTSSPSISLRQTARRWWRAPPRTRTCSGACAAVAAISAWSPRSSIGSTRSGRFWPGRCCTRSPKQRRR
jgi:hypothetical protein